MSDTETLTAARVPTVYFIDDSATMREVIKIAFRKENIHVVTCADAASALEQFSAAAPDAVITDVIMPDKDGYHVCEFIKQHERFSRTPVILMSGVVNRTVAERAMSVKADDLIRKPFQPQDLVGRVKGLLATKFPALASETAGSTPAAAPANPFAPAGAPQISAQALTDFFAPTPPAIPVSAPPVSAPQIFAARAETPPMPRRPVPGALPERPVAAVPSSAELQKLRSDVVRLELLVKKLQAELEAEHQYCAALEAHFKALQG